MLWKKLALTAAWRSGKRNRNGRRKGEEGGAGGQSDLLSLLSPWKDTKAIVVASCTEGEDLGAGKEIKTP